MPKLGMTGWNNGFSWRITELSSPFNTKSYISAGLTSYEFTVGGVTSISGIVSEVEATADRQEYTTPTKDVAPYNPGTYTFWAWCKDTYGRYWPAGSGSVTVTSATSTRPSNWNWLNDIASGGEVNLTAAEWESFCDRINDFRRYKGLSNYSFTVPVAGVTQISASICNEAWTAINAITGHGTMPSKAVSRQPLTASFFWSLRSALNAIT